MTFLRALFLNFLIVFFVDRTIPGISVQDYGGQSPDLFSDVIFAVVIGLLNSAIFPGLYILGFKPTLLKMAICAFVISFGGFFFLMLVDYGVQVTSFGGLFFGGLIVFCMSLCTNVIEKKYHPID